MTQEGHSPYYDHGGKIPNWLMHREVSMGAKVTFARLAQYAGKKTIAYPSVSTLARELGVSRRMTVTYLKELFEHGVLAREARPGRATCYRLLPHKWQTEWAEARKGGNNTSQVEAREGTEGGNNASQVGRNNASQVGRNNASQGWEEYFPQKIIKEDNQEEDPQEEEMGSADAPPSRSPEPKQQTLAPDPGSYQERTAREPDAKSEVKRTNGKIDIEKMKGDLAEGQKKRMDAQLKKQRKRDQAVENLNGEGKSRLTAEQKKDLNRLGVTWRIEMQKRFPDLAMPEWDAKNWGQAGNLITKYDGRSAGAAVKYVVRRWDEFKKQYFKGVGTVPTIGMILNLHETIVPVAVQWEKHADTLEEWEKFYAEHPYDDPPAELEKKYRAAKAKLNSLGLA